MNEKFDEELMKQLFSLRTKNKITMKEMGEKIGIKRLHYLRLEKGDVPLTKKTKEKIINVIEELLTNERD